MPTDTQELLNLMKGATADQSTEADDPFTNELLNRMKGAAPAQKPANIAPPTMPAALEQDLPSAPNGQAVVAEAIQNRGGDPMQRAELMPRDYAEAITFARERGVDIRYSPQMAQDIETLAQVYTEEWLLATGNRDIATDDQVIKLRQIFRDISTIMQGPISPDEVPRVGKEYTNLLIGKVLDFTGGKLQEFHANGVDPNNSEVKYYQEIHNKYRGLQARADDPSVQEKFRQAAWLAHWETRPDYKAITARERRAINALEWLDVARVDPRDGERDLWATGGAAVAAGAAATTELEQAAQEAVSMQAITGRQIIDDMKRLFRDKDDPTAGHKLTAASWRIAADRARFRMLGVPEEAMGVGIIGAAEFTHPIALAGIVREFVARKRVAETKPKVKIPKTLPLGIGPRRAPGLKRQRGLPVEIPGAQAVEDLINEGLEKGFIRDRVAEIDKWLKREGGKSATDMLTHAANSNSLAMLEEQIKLFDPTPLVQRGEDRSIHLWATTGNFAKAGFQTALDVMRGGMIVADEAALVSQGLTADVIEKAAAILPDGAKHHALTLVATLTNKAFPGDFERLREGLRRGDVDPGVLYRIVANHTGKSVIANMGILLSGFVSKDRLQHALGRIARDQPELLTRELVTQTLRQQYNEAIEEALNKGTFLATDEDVDFVDQRTAASLKNNGLFSQETVKSVFSAASVRISRELRSTIHFGLADPGNAGLLFGGTYLFGKTPAGKFIGSLPGKALKLAAAPATQWVRRGLQMSRLRKIITNLAFWDAYDALTVRRNATKLRAGAMTDSALEKNLRATEAAAENMVRQYESMDAQGLTDATAAERARSGLNGGARRFRRTLQQFSIKTLSELLDGVQIPQNIAEEIAQTPSFLGTILEEFAERIKWNTRELYPHLVERGRNLAKELNDIASNAAKTGVEPEAAVAAATAAAQGLPFSINLVDRGAGPLRNWLSGKLDSNFWGAIFGRDVKTQPTLMHDMARFATEYLPAAVEYRALQAQLKVQVMDMIEQLRTRMTNEARDLEASLAGAELSERGPIMARVEELTALAERANTDLGIIDGRHVDTPTDITKTEYWRDATLQDVNSVVMQHEPMGLSGLWARIAKQGEKFEKFEENWNAVMQGVGDEAWEADVKRRIGKEYFRTDGLQKVNIDLDTSKVMLPKVARKIYNERQKIAAQAERLRAKENLTSSEQKRLDELEETIAADPAKYDPAEDFGFKVIDLPAETALLKRWANTFDNTQSAKLPSVFSGLDPIDISTFLSQVRDAEVNIRQQFAARSAQAAAFTRRLDALTDAELARFNKAYRDWAAGEPKPLQQFMRERPMMFPQTADDHVSKLLLDSQEFREGLLRDALSVNLITQAEFDALIGPYAPHMYASHLTGQLLDRHGKIIKADRKFAPSGPQDMTETMSQRDLFRTRVLIKQQDAPRVRQEFDTPEQAARWVKERYGVRKDSLDAGGQIKRDGKDMFGLTALGDEFEILAPVGKESMARLGLIPEGEGLAFRYQSLIRDIHAHKFLSGLNRPRWVMSAEDFAKRRQLKDDPTFGKWRSVPNTRSFGPLAGKWVHPRVYHEMMFFFDTEKAFKGMAAELQAARAGGTGADGLLTKGLDMIMPAAQVLQRGMITNAIQRMPGAWLLNLMMDREYFARFAGGRDFLYSDIGNEARKSALRMLFGVEGWMPLLKEGFLRVFGLDPTKPGFRGKLAREMGVRKGPNPFTDLLDPEANHLSAIERKEMGWLFEDGILADSILGAQDPGVQAAFVERLFGKPDVTKQPKMPPGLEEFQGMSGQEIARFMFDDGKNPQLRTIQARLSFLEREIPKIKVRSKRDVEELTMMLNDKARLKQALLDGDAVHGINLRARAARALEYTAGLGDGTGVGGSVRSISREFYGRASNVYRAAVYLYHIRRGKTREFAKRQVRLFMQDYGGVPRGVQEFRKHPLGAAITSFPYEMSRITANMMTHKPVQFAAALSVVPMLNMFTMAAAGVDPYGVLTAMGENGGMPAWMQLMNTLQVSDFQGGVAPISIAGMHPLLLMRRGFGLLGDVLSREDFGDAGLLGDILYGGVNTIGKFFLSNPLINFALTWATNKDPFTQRPYENRTVAAGEGAKQLMSLLVHPWWPYIGAMARQTNELASKPPHLRTGNIATPVEAFVQAVTGVRTRGGILDRVADVTNTTAALDWVTRRIADYAAFPGSKANVAMKFRRQAKGLNEKDVLNSLLWRARKVDKQSENTVDVPLDQNFSDLRTAHSHIAEGERGGDEKQKRFGQKLLNDTLASIQKNLTVVTDINGIEMKIGPRSILGVPPRELTGKVRRLLAVGDMDEGFDDLSPVQQTWMILEAGKTTMISDKRIGMLAVKALLTDSGQMSAAGDLRRLIDSINMLETGLATFPYRPRTKEILLEFYAALRKRLKPAADRFVRENFQKANNLEALRLILEAQKAQPAAGQ